MYYLGINSNFEAIKNYAFEAEKTKNPQRIAQLIDNAEKQINQIPFARQMEAATMISKMYAKWDESNRLSNLKGASHYTSSGPSEGAASPSSGEKAIGIINPGRNCWAIGLLHLLHQLPQFKAAATKKITARIETQIPIDFAEKHSGLRSLLQLLEEYDQRKNIDSQKIRLALLPFANEISPNKNISQDPLSALEPLLDFLGMEYKITSTFSAIGKENRTKKGETTDQPKLIDCSIKPSSSISEQLRASLLVEIDYSFETGEDQIPARQVKKLTYAPINLLVKANRFEWTPEGQRKITTPIKVDEELTLGEGELQHGPEAVFELDSCVLHHGQGINGGHYTTLVRTRDGGWEWANDREVHKWNGKNWVEVQSGEESPYQQSPKDLMAENCYLLNYKKVAKPPEKKHRPLPSDGQQPAGQPLRSAGGNTNSDHGLVAPLKTTPSCTQKAIAIGLNFCTYVVNTILYTGYYYWNAFLMPKSKQG